MTAVRALISDTDASFRIYPVETDLENLQKLVGGYIEAVHFDNGHVYCNEEGKLQNQPINSISTVVLNWFVPGFLTRDVLVGTVVWLGDAGGDEGDLPVQIIHTYIDVAMNRFPRTIGVVRRGNEVWVYDDPQAAARQVKELVTLASLDDEHGVIEVLPGVNPNRWVELRVELVDHDKVTLHDKRADRSFG